MREARGWRRRRGIKMEDEEVAESWEEAADSGQERGRMICRVFTTVRQEKGNRLCQANSCFNKFSGLVNDQRAEGLHNNDLEIDRRLEKKLKITQKESRKSKSPPKVPIVIQDDSLPAGPPPQIRILKRPTTNGVLSNPNSASRPAFPVKSLAQREAEYAEARKRILGSASPEEEQEKPILDRPPRISQPEDSRQPNNVIRQPLGPDGSQGFKQRR
ncbi:SUZ RNA-binding domain-containing isoform X3 [Balearica regulorum gibbericeps]|uniref:SUZ RNA-binding domain-containing isoform X3 n=1 Tax=Balearica regulorum gibbericeps TaxID=100784 RepID=UPI003F600DF5